MTENERGALAGKIISPEGQGLVAEIKRADVVETGYVKSHITAE